MRNIHDILAEYWGYEKFRPLQEEIIQSVLSGQDTLALLPTGGGKSICFQVPTLALEGLCLVISPLIALMKDQVQQLQQRGIRAAAIYSGISYQDIDRILDNAVFGHLQFLYLSPERLKTELLQERLAKMPLKLIAVDEAHCISQWGYDFRPAYLQIADIRQLVPQVPLIALTATATPEVALDIQAKLQFGSTGTAFNKSFIRSNLAYVVRKAEGKLAQLQRILDRIPGSAVVYVRNRRRTKEIAIELVRRNIRASFYHAGLNMEDREARQEAWINGKIRVMVATNAFGMGIDKANVRSVIHLELPDSLEAYFQEAGRAGRDGEKAYAVLLYTPTDKDRLQKQLERSFPEMDTIRQVYRALGSYLQLATGAGEGQSFDFDLPKFAETYQLDGGTVYYCLKVLEQEGWLAVSEAVYIPASLQIIVNKDVLYDYQLKNPKQDQILKIVLRSYQGAFNYPVKLKEKQLAKFLKISTSELRKGLLSMHQSGIIRYRAAKDHPQIILLRERVPAENLSINFTAYRERKERQSNRLQAAISYAETDICRSQQLVRYFGEKGAARCGVCDVCLTQRKQPYDTHTHQQLSAKIQELLEESPLSIQEIVGRFQNFEEAQILQCLSFLMDEGFVEQAEAGILHWRQAK
ncbi:MAG: ATP-dependent DNA helicase RecQ [Bacteroidota bacterium]